MYLLTRHDERFFVGQCDSLSLFHRFVGAFEARATHDGGNHNVRGFMTSQFRNRFMSVPEIGARYLVLRIGIRRF